MSLSSQSAQTPGVGRHRLVWTLGLTQTLAWGSSYYLPAMLARSIARDLGVSIPTVFAAFSVALIFSAVTGPWAGTMIDRWGGRPMLAFSNGLFACGLLVLGSAQEVWALFGAWLILGVAMGIGLYEGAFATIVRLIGADSRGSITGVTLIAGFASTVGWPLSSLLELNYGWRGACYVWAAMHLIIGLPLNLTLPKIRGAIVTPSRPEPVPTESGQTASDQTGEPSNLVLGLLAFVFATTLFTTGAMAAHLPGVLQAAGASVAASVAAGALIGPAQVGARLLEFGILRRAHPIWSARLAAIGHPLGAGCLLWLGAPAVAAFALLHGAGNGILTIAKGSLPLAYFGPAGYGARQGWLMMPAKVMQALSPYLFGLALVQWGANALWLTGLLGLAALAALSFLPRH